MSSIKSMKVAGVFFLLVSVLVLALVYFYSMVTVGANFGQLIWESAGFLLIAFACFRANPLLLGAGFGIQAAIDAINIWNYIRMQRGILYPLLLLVVNGLMTLLALIAWRGKKRLPVALCLLPFVGMLLIYVRSGLLNALWALIQPPRLIDTFKVLSQLCKLAGVLAAGLALHHFCPQEKPSTVEPVYVPAEEPPAPAEEEVFEPAYDQATLDTLQAYKDLLDTGILTQEEYDQKVYELTHV